jgi:Flp pilus assembly secretin CpaC
MVLNSEKTEPFTYEIFAAIIGFAITALTTWSLLGKQTENELNKEVRIRFLTLKTTIYQELIRQLEDIVRKEKITHEDIIELRLLSQRMIFIAGENVLVAFNKFVIRFVRLAKNEKISEKDLDDLLDEMSMVSVEIRNDILDKKAKQDMDVQSFEKLILKTNELMDFSDN